MTLLTREAILAPSALPTEEVDVSEWVEGGTILVRCLTGAERGQLELDGQKIQKGDEATMATIRAKVAVWCCVDETGKRLFEQKDVAALSAKHPAPLDRIWDAARRLSGLGEEGRKRASKTSSSRSDDSGTSSPSPSAE